MPESLVSPRFLSLFVETLLADIGQGNLSAVLEKNGLPTDWIDPAYMASLSRERRVEVYAGLQSALRIYYGRGARGTLLRIGSKMWERLLNEAALSGKAQAALVRTLPLSTRYKPALELLAGLISTGKRDINVHTLDLDFLLVDRTSPTTFGQKDSAPICYVTLGLIHEALYWAVGKEHDVEETACRAAGASECEFKITVGGFS